MVTFEGDVKVVDFGIAKEHGAPEDIIDLRPESTPGASDLTRTGIVVGKRAYLSPERIAGMSATPASDIFSLGVVMYELLTLRRPFLGKDPTELARAIMTGDFLPLDDVRSETPPALVEIVAKALAAKTEIRYADAKDLASDLRLVARELPLPDVGVFLREWFPKKWEEEQRMLVTGKVSETSGGDDHPTGPSLVTKDEPAADAEDSEDVDFVSTARLPTDD